MDKITEYKNCKISKFSGSEKDEIYLDLIKEDPLSIQIQGKPHTVVMRTPGAEIAQVAGFCLGEGIVDTLDDFASLEYCGEDGNVVTVTLKPERILRIPDVLKRRRFVRQAICGICGKELINDLKQNITPVPEVLKIDIKTATYCLNTLSDHQTLRQSCHAAAIFTSDGKLLSVGEDVARHNALDKSIGKLFQEEKLNMGALLVLSSRISYELVQKAARAKISVIFAVSGPTALAVELAESLGMALVCRARNKDLFVFCGEHRLAMA